MKSTSVVISAALAAALAALSALAAASALAEPGFSQCGGGGVARIDAIVEPWRDNTRTFANGKIRIVHLDTAEPACCSFHLGIMAPNPADEPYPFQCVTLNDGDAWTGFQAIHFADIEASYDPGLGLLLSVPAERYIDGLKSTPLTLQVRINQATGSITLE